MTRAKATKPNQEALADILRALSAGFLYPDAAWLVRARRLLSEGSLLDARVDKIRILLETVSREELEIEHVRLFGSAELVSLGLATHLSENPFEQAKQAAQIAGFFKAFGVEIKEGMRPDDLPAILEFLGYLWLKVFNARQKNWKDKEETARSAALALARDFVSPALSAMAAKMKDLRAHEFYLKLAEISKEVSDAALR